MRLTTWLLPAFDAAHDDEPTEVAVVIDVLRATSVMVAALRAGADQILTCREVDEARQIAASRTPRALLCGERGCRPIEGFDFGNSPAEYRPERIQGRDLVLTTTNGTRAIAAVERVPRVLIASFLNLSAVVTALADADGVRLVCAGTEGQVTLEDVLLAGALVWKCQRDHRAEPVDDASVLATQLWQSWFPEQVARGVLPDPTMLSLRFRETQGGKNLLGQGFDADLDRCAAIDSIPVVPERVADHPATFALPVKPFERLSPHD